MSELVEVFGERQARAYSTDFGDSKIEEVYPIGTKRIVDKYFFLPRKVNGVKVRGSQRVRQVCVSNTRDVFRGEIKVEIWEDEEILSSN